MMEEHHKQQLQYYQQQLQPPAALEEQPERRIARSGSSKDRHSKVRTAKGLRDRRVRLSAHTAIRFYDVQDRLGYDRPSKAVDWLIKNAGAAISELPPSAPAGGIRQQIGEASGTVPGGYGFDSSYLPPSLDSDIIAETIKSFFPIPNTAAMAAAAQTNFHNYPSQPLSYNTGNQVQEDLRLSLQSSHQPITTMTTSTTDPMVLSSAPTSWGENSTKMATWLGESSSLNAMLGASSYRPLQPAEAWMSDSNQLPISQFGSSGFSSCFHIEEEHSDLSNK